MKITRKKIILISIITVGLLIILFFVLPLFNNARHTPRDVIRIADIKQIQTGLDLYFKDIGLYPDQVVFGKPLTYENKTYIGIVPKNRLPNDGNCSENFEYKYTLLENGKSYKIEYCLGDHHSEIPAGIHFATPDKLVN